jgi:single-strand DNA-binding protein
MNSLNRATLIGRVGKDPEIRNFQDTKKASFSLATSENWKDKEGNKKETTEWHLIVAWSNLAKIIENHVKKGDLIMIEGKITTRTWDKEGQKHYSTEIVANNLLMLGGKPAEAPESNVDFTDKEQIQDDTPTDESDLPF